MTFDQQSVLQKTITQRDKFEQWVNTGVMTTSNQLQGITNIENLERANNRNEKSHKQDWREMGERKILRISSLV